MFGALIIVSITLLLMILSIVLLPTIKVFKKFNISPHIIAVIIGALALIFCGFISFEEIFKALLNDNAVNPIKILVLFISMTVLSVFLDEIGFFNYIAVVVLKRAKKGLKSIFTYLYITVSILTVFTSNDIVILTFTPFIIYFCKSAKVNPIPFLIAEFVAANTFSMMLVIGNPTNIYLASFLNISFFEYLGVMCLPSILGGLTAYLVLFLLFHKQLNSPINLSIERVKLKSKGLLTIGLIHLISCTILISIASYLHLEMWLICLGFAISLFVFVSIYRAIKHKKPIELLHCIKRAPWELVPFVISMFIIVLSLKECGFTSRSLPH